MTLVRENQVNVLRLTLCWAEKSGIPWRAIKPHLDDVMEKARSLWPDALNNLPMNDNHQAQLLTHWKNLPEDFRVLV